jgi:taurine dioxygenase
MAAAHDAMPESLRQRISGRRALFSSEAYHSARLARTPRDPVTGELPAEQLEREKRRKKNVTQEHPMIKIHPRSGRRCVYFSEEAIERVVGVSDEESEDILEAVHRHVLQAQFVYRHRWRVGDLVMWDNISCLHKATGDFEYPKIRTMHRTTLVNTQPAVGA